MSLIWLARCDNCGVTSFSGVGWTTTGDKHYCPRISCQDRYKLEEQAPMLWELATMQSTQTGEDARRVQ